jgi:methyltransferase (TIGR00027 family)
LRTAELRAAHQVLDCGRIFTDPLALRILGSDGAETIKLQSENDPPSRRRLRLFIAVRARFAEDALTAAAVTNGARQLVVLGAGLDTYAYRSTLGDLRVFEVDDAATQAWKQQRLAEAAIPLPSSLAFVPLDFEREPLADALGGAGFDSTQRSFFTWLGVVPYLTEQAIFSTLRFIASLPGGASVVFDYANPLVSLPEDKGRTALEAIAARGAALGEPFKTYFDTDHLGAKLTVHGFRDIEDLGPAMIAARYFSDESNFSGAGAHIVRAATIGHGSRRNHPSPGAPRAHLRARRAALSPKGRGDCADRTRRVV